MFLKLLDSKFDNDASILQEQPCAASGIIEKKLDSPESDQHFFVHQNAEILFLHAEDTFMVINKHRTLY